MAQFDVFVNPVAAARRAYPFVVAMQSDFSVSVEQLVAPIASLDYPLPASGRITPIVSVDGKPHVVVVPRLAVVRSRDLEQRILSIAAAREELLAAIDYLFFGF